MLNAVFDLARPLLFALDPEQAHELTLKSLEAGIYPRPTSRNDGRIAIELWGLTFSNPFGIAAGFDKDARVANAVLGMGFGHTEVGTLTPLPQAGNARPRVFRLPSDRALINRLGFNNGGHAAALERLRSRVHPRHSRGVIGVNVGANKDAADRTADYVLGIERFYDVASYLAINISSPNTPGLRDLQAPATLHELLTRVLAARAALVAAGKVKRPIVVKLAPDIAPENLEPIAQVLLAHGVDGIAVSNTTVARDGISDGILAAQAGGLSGRPLFHRSTVVLARIYQFTAGRIPLIGLGGIDSAATAIAKIEAGATLLQLYTGLIYAGPGLLPSMQRALSAYVARNNFARIADATGCRAAEWAAKSLHA